MKNFVQTLVVVFATFFATCTFGQTEITLNETTDFSVSTTEQGTFPLKVSFDASILLSNGANPAATLWNFADGNTARGGVITHTFNAPGVFEVALVIFDKHGIPSTATKTIHVLDIFNNVISNDDTTEGMMAVNN